MRITLLPAAVYGFVLLLVIAIIAQSTSRNAFCADQKWHRTILKLLHERHVNRVVCSFSGGGTTICTLCPSGFYQENYVASFCFVCDLGLYDGKGSIGVAADGLCFLEKPSKSPLSAPTSQPSIEPSASLRTEPPPSTSSLFPLKEASREPSATPSLTPLTPRILVPSAAPSFVPSLMPTSEQNFPADLSSLIIKVDQDLNFEEGVCSDDESVRSVSVSTSIGCLVGLLAVCILVLVM